MRHRVVALCAIGLGSLVLGAGRAAGELPPGNTAGGSVGTVQVGSVSAGADGSTDTVGDVSRTVETTASSSGAGGNGATGSVGTVQLDGGNTTTGSVGAVQTAGTNTSSSGAVSKTSSSGGPPTPTSRNEPSAPASGQSGIRNSATGSIVTAQAGGGNTAAGSVGTVQIGGGSGPSEGNSAVVVAERMANLVAQILDVFEPRSDWASRRGSNSATGSIGTVQVGGGNSATGSIGTAQIGALMLKPSATLGSEAVGLMLSLGGESGFTGGDSPQTPRSARSRRVAFASRRP